MMNLWRRAWEAVPILWRLMTSDDFDRFFRESAEFRAKHGIGGQKDGRNER